MIAITNINWSKCKTFVAELQFFNLSFLTVVFLGSTLSCHAQDYRQYLQKALIKETIVLDEASLTDSFNAPVLELARAIRVRPQTRIFHVKGYFMFGGWQTWNFWFDRQTHRLRYKYASGGETSGGKEEGVWLEVTDQILEHLAQDHRTDNYSGTKMLGFETLGKYGCRLENARKTSRALFKSAPSPELTGTYTRIKHRPDENQSAQLDITEISRSRVRFHLTTLWWPVGNSDSPHNGEIEAAIPLRNHVAVYADGSYRLTMRFRPHSVVLTERGSNPEFGASVSAAGIYQRSNDSRAKAGAR